MHLHGPSLKKSKNWQVSELYSEFLKCNRCLASIIGWQNWLNISTLFRLKTFWSKMSQIGWVVFEIRFKIKKYTLFNNNIGESAILVPCGHGRECLGRNVTSWNISMTSSQSGLPPCKIWTYLLKKFMRYWDLKNGAIWLAESLFQNISRTRFFPDMRFSLDYAGHWAE